VQVSRSIFSSYKTLKHQLQICDIEEEIEDLQTLLDDPELGEEVGAELIALKQRLADLQKSKPDPDDSKNAVFEIQSGVGGDESALFVADLYKIYEAYCSNNKNEIEVIDFTPGNAGGFKSISFTITGETPYGKFKYESGCHRVQRVPSTETKGRVHTSIATLIVLPEIMVEDVELNKTEVKVEPYNSGGKGGQHCNKSMNAVKLTHLPTGISACSQMKSFIQNLKIAWKVLATRISDAALQQQTDAESEKKKNLRGRGSRSEKIRTYNFPQARVTDHRIKQKYSLPTILAGSIEDLLEDLTQLRD
jgi:peptide chain release factor 1